jgi:hypothetical protein
LSPTQFGVNPARLPKFTFEPEPAYADSADDIAQPFGKLLNLGASVELLNQTGTSVRVRYVVTNTDRATLTNLRIGLMLTAGETVVSSTPAASQSGLELSYSLGDLAGTTSGEVILELQRSGGNGQVDFGAKAFASYLGSGVSAKTIPAQVKIPNAAPELLSSTVDANSHDPSSPRQESSITILHAYLPSFVTPSDSKPIRVRSVVLAERFFTVLEILTISRIFSSPCFAHLAFRRSMSKAALRRTN